MLSFVSDNVSPHVNRERLQSTEKVYYLRWALPEFPEYKSIKRVF